MTRYLTTRKRNNKKYKKSRTGRGKGRRSIRRCKTRKPKGFKKAKRYTVVKRRRMVGGDFPYNFKISSESLQKYIKTKYGKDYRLVLVGFGRVMITNRSKGFFNRTDHRHEQVAVFACYEGVNSIPVTYALARCAVANCYKKPDGESGRPHEDMEKKILFLTYADGQVKLENIEYKLDEAKSKNPSAVNLAIESLKKRYSEVALQKLKDNFKWFEFKNSISSTDKYRIIMSIEHPSLVNLFTTLADINPYTTQISYPAAVAAPAAPAAPAASGDPAAATAVASDDMGFFGPLWIFIAFILELLG